MKVVRLSSSQDPVGKHSTFSLKGVKGEASTHHEEPATMQENGPDGEGRISKTSNQEDFCSLKPNELREKVLCICRDFLIGAWMHIKPDEMILTRVSGGLSNLLFYVSLPKDVQPINKEPKELLIRIYGQINKERAMEALVTECVVFTLVSELQRGPRLYGVFKGGRLEEFIKGKSMVTQNLSNPRFSAIIADKLAQIHMMIAPLIKRPVWLWNTLDTWMEEIELRHKSKRISSESWKMLNKFTQINLRDEIEWIKTPIAEAHSPVVFCHNDIQEGNILVKDRSDNKEVDNENVVIIDYEYCAYNYRGFDFANHFCEWMYDYTNENAPYYWENTSSYPTQAQQEHFLRHYLESIQKSKGYRPREEDTLPHLLKEAETFTMVAHLFWALWSIVNTSLSSIDFDYWTFGETRLERYFQAKTKYLNKSSQL